MNAVVVGFRSFKIPVVKGSDFFPATDNSIHRAWMDSDLARSGLVADDIQGYITGVIRKSGQLAAYEFPYYDLDGRVLVDNLDYPTMMRARLKWPEFSKEQKYWQPAGADLIKRGLPPSIPFVPPQIHAIEGDTLVCCEGEKKTLSVVKHLGLAAFGIGGCYNWRDPDKSGAIHRWILELARRRGTKRFIIVPDGDIMRYNISGAYGTFAHTLRGKGFDVEILQTGDKIDDLLVQWLERGQDIAKAFGELSRIDPESLVQSSDSLSREYNLKYDTTAKGLVRLHQGTSNITILLKNHPSFPKVWLNNDTNRVMIGEDEARADHSEMEIANYFQHNLCMERVTAKTIVGVIRFLAHENARSPMLEWIKGQEWDGKQRLDSWITRLWGAQDTPITREIGAKWLVSACARMDKPGTKVDWMPIVVGPQGTGKTSMPGILFKGNARVVYGQDNDKDLHMKLHSALCIGFDELDSFGKRESSNLKAMVTNNEDAFRPPYGASVEVFPRRFTLYGCGNRYEFLQHDPSGYRRYGVVEVTKLLDFAGLEAERGQLWAEAWCRYQEGGCSFWEVEGASQNAELFVAPNVLEDQIIGWLQAQGFAKQGTNIKDGVLYFSMTQLCVHLNLEKEARNPGVTKEIAATLRGQGCIGGNTRKMIVPGVSGRHYAWKIPQQ